MRLLNIFRKKIKKKNTDNFSLVDPTKEEQPIFIEQPKICSFGLAEQSNSLLEKRGYNLYKGTFGNIVETNNEPNTGKYCLLNNNIPENIHEYDVLILDMCNYQSEPYLQSNHQKKFVDNHSDIYLFSEYPQTIFDPRAYSANILGTQLSRVILERELLVVVFASENIESEYLIVEKGPYNANFKEKKKFRNFSFLHNIPFQENKSGKEINIVTKNDELTRILGKYNYEYKAIFYHPSESFFSKSPLDPNFFPLMYNKDKEIISFHRKIGKSNLFVIPNLFKLL